MSQSESLFAKFGVHDVLRHQPAQLAKAIDALPDDQILKDDHTPLIEELIKEHNVEVPVLDVAATKTSQREVNVDVSRDPRRFFPEDTGPFYVKATEVTFRVPFKGERDAFFCRPSRFYLNTPKAEVERDAVVIRVVREDQNLPEYKKAFDQTVTQIQGGLDQLRIDLQGLEGQLRENATSQLSQRRDKRRKDQNLLDGLGFQKA